MASKNVVVNVGDSIRTLKNIARIKTRTSDGDNYCYWIPEDGVNLITKTIDQDGIYKASDDNAYGYSEVTVIGAGTNVLGDVVEKTIGPITDNGTYTYRASDDDHYGYSKVIINVNINKLASTDSDGDETITTSEDDPNTTPSSSNPNPKRIVTTKVPSFIKVEKLPNKTNYRYGETIDYTGIQVYAYLKSGKIWSDSTHSGGLIPFSELIFPENQTKAGAWSGKGGNSNMPDATGGNVQNMSVDTSQLDANTKEIMENMYNFVAPYLKDYDGKYPIIMYNSGNTISFHVFNSVKLGGVVDLEALTIFSSVNFKYNSTTMTVTEYVSTVENQGSEALFTGGRKVRINNELIDDSDMYTAKGLICLNRNASLRTIIDVFVYSEIQARQDSMRIRAVSGLGGPIINNIDRTYTWVLNADITWVLELYDITEDLEVFPYYAISFSEPTVDPIPYNEGVSLYANISVVSDVKEHIRYRLYLNNQNRPDNPSGKLLQHVDWIPSNLYGGNFHLGLVIAPLLETSWPAYGWLSVLGNFNYSGGSGKYFDGYIDVSGQSSENPSGSTNNNSTNNDTTEFDQTLKVSWNRPQDSKQLSAAFNIHIGNTEEGWTNR